MVSGVKYISPLLFVLIVVGATAVHELHKQEVKAEK